MASPQTNAAPTASTRSILTSLGIVILAQLPMLLVYFGELWKRPHYRFFPVAILAVLLLVYRAWPREKFRVLKSSRASLVMLFSGCASAILGYVLMVPWFSMLSLCLIVTSGLLLVYDEDSRRSLGIQALPLFFILLVPLNGDYQFLSFLHRPSSDFASRILEVRGVGHLLTGTTIEMAGKSFEIENASRGVQSCFVLLFAASLLVAWNRRSLFHLFFLLLIACLTAIVVNVLRIVSIPFADLYLNANLATGISHEIVGYMLLVLGLMILWSADHFLRFLFGAVEDSADQSGPFSGTITYIWNHLIAGDPEVSDSRSRRNQIQPISKFENSAIFTVAVFVAIVGVLQLVDFYRCYSFSNQNAPARFSIAPLIENDLPVQWVVQSASTRTEWERKSYLESKRHQGSDLGIRSDTWTYISRDKLVKTRVSFDQTFLGWHELTVQYQNAGWKLENREVKTIELEKEGENLAWDYVEARFSKPTGQQALLLFSSFDSTGAPLRAPTKFGLNSLLQQFQRQFEKRIGNSLFRPETYQSQVFMEQFGPLSDSSATLATGQFLDARNRLRDRFLQAAEQSR